MKALKKRGVGETTILGQWWSKGLFLEGKAYLFQGENALAVTSLKKGSKVRWYLTLPWRYTCPSGFRPHLWGSHLL